MSEKTPEQQLALAKILICRLILWTQGIPDRNGSYEIANEVYRDANQFLTSDLPNDKAPHNEHLSNNTRTKDDL
jgi:hypothetical protein